MKLRSVRPGPRSIPRKIFLWVLGVVAVFVVFWFLGPISSRLSDAQNLGLYALAIVIYSLGWAIGRIDGENREREYRATAERWKAEDDARRAREEAAKIDPHILSVEIVRPPKDS